MIEELLIIPTKSKKKLKALLRKPEKNGTYPAVIFVAGLGMRMHEWNNSFDEIAERLVAKGFATLQFAFDIFDKDVHCRELPLNERARELTSVLDWLLKRPEIDLNRIGILAQSFGVSTIMVADLKDSRSSVGLASQGQALRSWMSIIKSLVFVSGVYFPYKSITRVYTKRGTVINYDGDTTLPPSSGELTTVGKEFWESLKNFDQEKEATNLFTESLLMIHGDNDEYIPVRDAQEVFGMLRIKNKKLKVFKGGDHGITDVPKLMREEFLTLIADWYKKTL